MWTKETKTGYKSVKFSNTHQNKIKNIILKYAHSSNVEANVHTDTSHNTQTASALLILYNLLGFAKQIFSEKKNVGRVQFLPLNQIGVNHAKTTITKKLS